MPETHAAAADRGRSPLRRRGLRVRPPRVRRAADRLARLDRLSRLARLRGAAPGRDRPGAGPRAAGVDAARADLRQRGVRRAAAQAARAARGQGGDRGAALARRARRGRGAGGDRGGRRGGPSRPASRRTGAARCWRSGRRCGSTRARASCRCCATATSPPRSTRATTPPTSTRSAASRELVEMGRLGTAVRIGVRSDEGPSALAQEADLMVEGPTASATCCRRCSTERRCGSATSSGRRSSSAPAPRRCWPRSR